MTVIVFVVPWSDVPDNLPKTVLFVRVAVSVVPTLVSTSVSNSCNAVFTVLLFVIVEPVKVPRWSLDSETPDKVIRW